MGVVYLSVINVNLEATHPKKEAAVNDFLNCKPQV